MNRFQHVLVIGGAGYVGAVLVPKMLEAGYRVTVFDLFIYGEDVFDAVKSDPKLKLVRGDMRDATAVADAMKGCDAVIHLACISNDPSFELDPELGKSINLDSFRPTVKAAKKAGVRRFIYASSSSVYGVKEGVAVTEDLSLEPLTDYSKFKVACEKILTEEREPGFVTAIIRPATVCGYSPARQRLDVIVNILTNHAVHNNKIKIMGGAQLRPNIHIQDMARVYLKALELPDEKVDGESLQCRLRKPFGSSSWPRWCSAWSVPRSQIGGDGADRRSALLSRLVRGDQKRPQGLHAGTLHRGCVARTG